MSNAATDPGVSAAKKVALRLQGLSTADRSWLLTRLNSSQRQQVINAEQSLLRVTGNAAINFQGLLEGGTEVPTLPEEARVFQRWPAKQVANALDELPALWVAGLFQFTSWHGAGRYLLEQSPERRRAIQAGHLPLKSAACIALCNALEDRLEED